MSFYKTRFGHALGSLGLAAMMYGCGGDERQGCRDDYDCREPRVCVEGYCEDSRGGSGNGGNNPACDNSLVTDICYRYWNECNLSSNSKTNYRFGDDLNDCIRRGCSFLQGVQTYPYYENDAQREELMEAIRCFADLKMKHSPELTCDALADDICGLPEGDLYGCWINQTTGC